MFFNATYQVGPLNMERLMSFRSGKFLLMLLFRILCIFCFLRKISNIEKKKTIPVNSEYPFSSSVWATITKYYKLVIL